MTEQAFRTDLDADGILTLTWDMAGRSMNVITVAVMDELEALIARVSSEAEIKGAVIASGKEQFSGGADLTMLEGLGRLYADMRKAEGEEKAMTAFFEASRRLTLIYRKLETGGKPWVAAINGVCLGGAFELALACHHRVLSAEKGRVGLPEIKVGLFPGAGGTQRVARIMPTGDALQMLFKGEQLRPDKAKAMKLVDQVVPEAELVETAKAWIKAGNKGIAPWDKPDFKAPSGRVFSPTGMQTFPPANAILRRETYDNYPAAKAILQAVFDGLQLPMDLALRVESRLFAKILRSTEAQAMMRTFFVSMQELNKGARRPAGIAASRLKTVGIIGAGFMGAGIAYVSAQAGLNVVLIDRDQESADKGKAHAETLSAAQVSKGRMKKEEREALLGRITATADYAALAGVDLVVEAVFEDRKVKEGAIAAAEAAMKPGTVFASNTSTLPITSLGAVSKDPAKFVGIHFFSPVDKMLLVEIIKGEQTGDEAIAAAFDFVLAIKKTPILVNDSRGFFANRCVTNYVREGHLMLMEGVPAAMVENVARMAGMPVGPLSLNDEVAIDLAWKILQAAKTDLGDKAVDPTQEKLLDSMVNQHQRLGRKNRKGFYDYPEKGAKTLWPGLKDIAPVKLDPDSLDVAELKNRLLFVQAIEAARTVEDGVVEDPREADVGSILGFGFAPYSGGALSFIDFMGAKRFVATADALSATHGERFAVPALLRDMAAKGETFYGRFAAKGAKEAA